MALSLAFFSAVPNLAISGAFSLPPAPANPILAINDDFGPLGVPVGTVAERVRRIGGPWVSYSIEIG